MSLQKNKEDYKLFNIVKVDENGNMEKIQEGVDNLLKIMPTLERRDLNMVDGRFNFKVSSILTKNKTILIKLDYLKCIIHDKVAYFFMNYYPGSFNNFFNKLVENIKSKDYHKKFRLKILEEIFINVVEHFEKEILISAPKVSKIKTELSKRKSSAKIGKNFIEVHNDLANIQLRLKDIYELFEEIDPDKDEKVQNDFYSEDGVQEDQNAKKITFEDIIDNYRIRFEDSYRNVKQMINILKTLLNIHQTSLSITRNKLTLVNIYLTMFAIFVSFSSLIAGIFGMNVPNHLEESNKALPIIVVVVILLILSSLFVLKFLKSKLKV